MLLSEKARLIICFFILLACILGINHLSKAEEHQERKVLMLGLELKDLNQEERSRFAHYQVLERPFLSGDLTKELVKQVRPESILIKQPSGSVYEYSSNGSLIKQVQIVDSRQTMLEEQQKKSIYLPKLTNNSSMSFQPGRQIPIQITGQMQIGNYNGQFNNSNTAYNSPSMAQTTYTMPNWQNTKAYQNGHGFPNNSNMQSHQQPFPGANIPLNLYPEPTSNYLPGEGEFLPPPTLSAFRQGLRQASTLAQNTAYPFWFDSYLTTDTNTLNNFGSSSSGTAAGFPTLQFNANTTANGAIVASQWIGTGIGLGATLLDTALEGADLKARREKAYRDSRGTAYYQYPQYARTSYPSMPYQPIPTSPWY